MPHSQVSSSASDLLSDSTRASSVTAFHRPNRSTGLVVEENNSTLSPAIEGFQFTDFEPTTLGPTLGEHKQLPPVAGAGISFDIDFDEKPTQIMMQQDGKHQHRKTLDGSIPPTPSQSQSDSNSSKRRTQYYEDSLAYKGHSQSTKERIQKDSPVIAELRTNVIIKDEFTVVTNLSQHLSERYRRPESSILITVTHSACLMMGGSFEPAYILTITAIPSEVQPVTNKRNAYLMQHFVADTLHVSSSRGVVRFMEIPEERLATNGSTIAGDIERTESNGVSRSMTNKSSRKSLIPSKRKSLLGRKISDELERKSSTKSTKSLKSLKSVKGKTSPPVPLQPAADLRSSLTNGSARDSSPAPVARGESPANHGSIDHTNTKTVASPLNSPSRPTTANRPGSSRMHLSNTSGNAQDFPAPPPVPETDRVPKISKRKSIIAMFKRGESAKSS